MNDKKEWLSRAECSALRGLAILGIMLHNYCHWLAVAVKENEYTFNIGNSRRLWYVLTHPDAYLPVHVVSYFGHYGVPVFLFLSGFGLVMKYERDGGELPVGTFIRRQYTKLFRMMIVGLTAFLIVDAITPGSFTYHAENIIAQLLMVINLLSHPDRIIWPGPYWFFGLMMQLYIVWRLLIFRRHWAVMAVLVAGCWLLQASCGPLDEELNRLRYNFIGGLLPFCAGVALARLTPPDAFSRITRSHWLMIAVLSSALTLALCFNFQTWLWAPVAVILTSVAVIKMLPTTVRQPLIWTGAISAAMFVTHPILRKIFIPISRHGDIYDGLLLYVVTAVTVAWLLEKLVFGSKR